MKRNPTDARCRRFAAALSGALGSDRWRLLMWDSRSFGPANPRFTVTLTSPKALDRLVGGMLHQGLGRAYVEGSLEIDPVEPFLEIVGNRPVRALLRAWPRVVVSAVAMGGRPAAGPVHGVESRLRGPRHTPRRDREAIRHHYDLPAAFYALWLDPSLTYSCAYFPGVDSSLELAQQSKLDLICRKLRLQAGERFLDVGCGWGSLVVHAAQRFGVRAEGITLSQAQVDYAQANIAKLGIADRASVTLADYRDTAVGGPDPFDAIASVGMVEHVGHRRLGAFASSLHGRLRPGGRLLLHGITVPDGVVSSRGSFGERFVFPDGELPVLGRLIDALQGARLEVRDVENLREHYVLTLAAWTERLDQHVAEATHLVGAERVRVWRLYLRAAAFGFRHNWDQLSQILAVRPHDHGESGLPLRRDDWYSGADSGGSAG